jgi:hypothetical protein
MKNSYTKGRALAGGGGEKKEVKVNMADALSIQE